MKVSYYPGCSLHGTAKEYDQSMRAVSCALGIELKELDDWSCCGGSLSISRTDLVVGMVDKLMTMAREAGANCVAVACPLCMANLDMRASNHCKLPVFYFTELIGVALGLEGPANWAKLHNLDPTPLLEGLGLL